MNRRKRRLLEVVMLEQKKEEQFAFWLLSLEPGKMGRLILEEKAALAPLGSLVCPQSLLFDPRNFKTTCPCLAPVFESMPLWLTWKVSSFS